MNHRFKSRLLGILGGLIVLATLAPLLRADGFIVPNPRHGEIIPPLTVKYHHVTVEIVNQVAKTSVDQVFVNNFDRDMIDFDARTSNPVPGTTPALILANRGDNLTPGSAAARSAVRCNRLLGVRAPLVP